MPIPTYDQLMYPVLAHAGEKTWIMKELIHAISNELGLSADEKIAQLPGGSTTIIGSRVHWAKTYLKKAGLITQPARAQISITTAGQQLLSNNVKTIDVSTLKQYPMFNVFLKSKPKNSDSSLLMNENLEKSATPGEQIASAVNEIELALGDALLTRIVAADFLAFEKLVLDLMRAMGYGGGEHLGKAGDGGVDGVIREDRLGINKIYLQAKRYSPENKIGPATVQAFLGALVNRGATRGVLLTTSDFTPDAIKAAGNTGSMSVILVDGQQLVQHMIENGVGVRTQTTIAIKSVDLSYFGEDELE